MELRLATGLNGAVEAMPSKLKVTDSGPNWLRYRTPTPQEDNPKVVRAMETANIPIVTLSEVGRTLEEVYLEVVDAADEAERRQAS